MTSKSLDFSSQDLLLAFFKCVNHCTTASWKHKCNWSLRSHIMWQDQLGCAKISRLYYYMSITFTSTVIGFYFNYAVIVQPRVCIPCNCLPFSLFIIFYKNKSVSSVREVSVLNKLFQCSRVQQSNAIYISLYMAVTPTIRTPLSLVLFRLTLTPPWATQKATLNNSLFTSIWPWEAVTGTLQLNTAESVAL